jgi:hypothetical protein
MTRRSDQLRRIEEALNRIEGTLAATRIEVRDARSSAEAASAGVQSLAGMLPAPDQTAAVPLSPAPTRRRTAAGRFAAENRETAERLHSPGTDAAGGTT